jgi:O-antigen ligase
MRERYRYIKGKSTKDVLGTNGILLGAIVIGTCFASFRWQKFGAAISDIPIVIAFFMAISSSTNLPYRKSWSGKLKPMLIAMYGYALAALLPIVSGGGFVLVQLAKDLFSFSIFPITFVTIARIVREERIELALRVSILVSAAIVSVTVLSGVGARSAGILGSPNVGGNWAAAFIIMSLLIASPKNTFIRYGMVFILLLASVQMASLGGILCTVTALAYWLPRRSQSLNIFKQILPFAITLLAPTILQAFDTYTGLDRYSRSSQGRLYIWSDALKTWLQRPLGLGIGNFSDPSLALTVAPEAHNDYISSLVEMGILGPIALGAICLCIAANGGLRTRTMIIFYLVSAVSHNSINFRHIWVCTAICFAYDVLPQLQKSEGNNGALGTKPSKFRGNRGLGKIKPEYAHRTRVTATSSQ